MRILILEDDDAKLQALRKHLSSTQSEAVVHSVGTFIDYVKAIERETYDFLILDLVVPRILGDKSLVEISEIVSATRGDLSCKNVRTPGIALTGYDEKAEDGFRLLNLNDLAVITYAHGSQAWATAIDRKIASLPSTRKFDFVIVCALDKEVDGFAAAGFELGEPEMLSGLRCRTIRVANRSGVLVTASRMGLVTAAITATQAIQAFLPQVICMSGICGGIPGEASIYDVVVAETCHQHDAGKWDDGKLRPEVYSVPIEHKFAQKARTALAAKDFLSKVMHGVTLNRDEFPEGINSFRSSVRLASASSGSAVLADANAVLQIKSQQRKCAIFEMESYAIYEAARLSPLEPQYFSVKTVVDDGGAGKSDCFHRVGCLLSARVVGELLALCDYA